MFKITMCSVPVYHEKCLIIQVGLYNVLTSHERAGDTEESFSLM